jgi:hypothetical protein
MIYINRFDVTNSNAGSRYAQKIRSVSKQSAGYFRLILIETETRGKIIAKLFSDTCDGDYFSDFRIFMTKSGPVSLATRSAQIYDRT